ncbi:MAG: YcgL domain-containing protein, partial [Porticoccaceae bacterium]|nr:YcgL domain-containing protein [Porticoccaceae bacterium]
MKILCDIYKTASKEGMYLYVSREDKLTRVPEFLLQRFAKPILVTTMLLSEKKKLAQADVLKVM